MRRLDTTERRRCVEHVCARVHRFAGVYFGGRLSLAPVIGDSVTVTRALSKRVSGASTIRDDGDTAYNNPARWAKAQSRLLRKATCQKLAVRYTAAQVVIRTGDRAF